MVWLQIPQEAQVESFFEASISVIVGDDRMALLLSDKWINGCSIRSLVPNLCTAVPTRVRNLRTVRDALLDTRWVNDISGA